MDFLLSLLAWWIAGFFYIAIRFTGATDNIEWATDRNNLYVLCFLGSTLFGIFYWIALVLSDKPYFRKRSYGFIILFKSIVVVLMTLVIVFITRYVAFVNGKILAEQIVSTFFERLQAQPTIIFILYVFFMSSVFSFIRQMRHMVGSKVLYNLILGNYHKPLQEDRIFMFLDLKSSTQIAENLGHVRFSQLIQDCFRDLTDAAIQRQVEIYQYVGDQVILSWKITAGLHNANCVEVFFDFTKSIQVNKDMYQKKYDVVPEFKAGLNLGPVTVAEVGVVKREIAYHGDTLNTTARIEKMCTKFNKKFLIAENLLQLLKMPDHLNTEDLGFFQLRGKQVSVKIYSIE